MGKFKRRTFLGTAGSLGILHARAGRSGVRIDDICFPYEDHRYRARIKFGGSISEHATLIDADCIVRYANGKVTITADYKAADAVAGEMHLAEPIPKLCTLVAASAFDGAITTPSASFMASTAVAPMDPSSTYHRAGGVDSIDDSDVATRVNDGPPETLRDWVRFNGLAHFKIKLNGDEKERRVGDWVYSLDFNKRCPQPLAAHVPHVGAIEPNARQYIPAARNACASQFPGIFRITDGTMATGEVTRPGLGAVEA